jgi:hypothetical protein
VVAMREDGEWERPPSARNADVSIEGDVRVGKGPGRRGPQAGERRDIDPASDVIRVRGIVDQVL